MSTNCRLNTERLRNVANESKQRRLLMSVRAGLLAIVDGLEEYLELPRTKDLRRAAKDERRDNADYAGMVANEA